MPLRPSLTSRPSFTVRQATLAALTLVTLRPLRGRYTGIASFFAGWMTGELAPQLLVAGAADTAFAVRRGKAGPVGLGLAAASAGGLALMTVRATRVGALVEETLAEGLGEDYLDKLTRERDRSDTRTSWRELARPFAMHKREVEVERDINYTAGGRRARLDVYRPRGVDVHDAPVLIQVHGGAWVLGRKEDQGQLLMNRLASHGWVCVAVNYRLAPKHPWPAQIIDIKKAIAWTREHIASYGGDPSYLVITGGSAGGHLAALAALTPGEEQWQPGFEEADTSVAACVPFYGVYDMGGITGDRAAIMMRDGFLGPTVFRKDPKEHLEDFEQASPLAHVGPDAPDFYALHGTTDTMVSVRQARSFVEALRERSRGLVLYTELPGAQHGFEIFSSIRSNATVRAVERFLEWHRATRREATSLDEPASADERPSRDD